MPGPGGLRVLTLILNRRRSGVSAPVAVVRVSALERAAAAGGGATGSGAAGVRGSAGADAGNSAAAVRLAAARRRARSRSRRAARRRARRACASSTAGSFARVGRPATELSRTWTPGRSTPAPPHPQAPRWPQETRPRRQAPPASPSTCASWATSRGAPRREQAQVHPLRGAPARIRKLVYLPIRFACWTNTLRRMPARSLRSNLWKRTSRVALVVATEPTGQPLPTQRTRIWEPRGARTDSTLISAP